MDASGNVYIAGFNSDNVFKIRFGDKTNPAVFEWGLVAMTLLVLTTGIMILYRRGSVGL